MSPRGPRGIDPDDLDDDEFEGDYLDEDEYGIGDDDADGEEPEDDEDVEALSFFRWEH
jgi:hypothetical protein